MGSVLKRKYEAPDEIGIGAQKLDRIMDRLVRSKVQHHLAVRRLSSGGAPLNYEIRVFFQSLRLRVLQGYGQIGIGPSYQL